MADAFPKKILPALEGKIGELRVMRFWSKVAIGTPEQCWPWQGSINSHGYGRFKLASYEVTTASRFSLISHSRQEPDGLQVLHHCDNPACCNPRHLYFGTHQQNMADKVARGRARTGDQSGANNGAAKITEDDLRVIVERLKNRWPNTRIAADLPISHAMVSKIKLGHMWREQTAALGWTPAEAYR